MEFINGEYRKKVTLSRDQGNFLSLNPFLGPRILHRNDPSVFLIKIPLRSQFTLPVNLLVNIMAENFKQNMK